MRAGIGRFDTRNDTRNLVGLQRTVLIAAGALMPVNAGIATGRRKKADPYGRR